MDTLERIDRNPNVEIDRKLRTYFDSRIIRKDL